MPVSALTSKGQITIPKAIRDALKIDAGDRVSFVLRDDGVVEMIPETVELLSLFGMVKPKRRGVTLADMEQAIADEASNE